MMDFTSGTWSDSLCATQATPHAMLLVGYTETTIRVKNRLEFVQAVSLEFGIEILKTLRQKLNLKFKL